MVVGIVCKEDNPEALSLSSEVIRRLSERGVKCLYEDHVASSCNLAPTGRVWSDSDLLVVIGGDGTILRAIRMSLPREVPILGVHMGYLGFLTEVTNEEVVQALDELLEGRYTIERRTMLEVTLDRSGTILAHHLVINDMVINKGALARIIHIEVLTDEVFVTSIWGDGLIVATPTGSTAYNLASGGPIVHPDVCALVLTPICPHVLSNRSIVLPDTQEIVIAVKSGKASDNIYLTLDGLIGHSLVAEDRIRVRRASTGASMVRLGGRRNYFEVLRSKLKWQER